MNQLWFCLITKDSNRKWQVSVFLLWRRKWWKCRLHSLQPFLVHDIFATKQFTTVIVTMSEADHVKRDERPPVPAEFFKYYGSAAKAGNSLYQCLKCPTDIKSCVISPSQITSYHHVLLLCMYDATLQCFRTP